MTPVTLWLCIAFACAGMLPGMFVALLVGFRAVNAEARERLAWRQVAQMRREREEDGTKTRQVQHADTEA